MAELHRPAGGRIVRHDRRCRLDRALGTWFLPLPQGSSSSTGGAAQGVGITGGPKAVIRMTMRVLAETELLPGCSGQGRRSGGAAREALRILEKRHPAGVEPSVSRALWALGNVLASSPDAMRGLPFLLAPRSWSRGSTAPIPEYMLRCNCSGAPRWVRASCLQQDHLEHRCGCWMNSHRPSHFSVLQRYLGDTLLPRATRLARGVSRTCSAAAEEHANGAIWVTSSPRCCPVPISPKACRSPATAAGAIPNCVAALQSSAAGRWVRGRNWHVRGDTALALSRSAKHAVAARHQRADRADPAALEEARSMRSRRCTGSTQSRERGPRLLATTTAPSAPEFAAAAELAR